MSELNKLKLETGPRDIRIQESARKNLYDTISSIRGGMVASPVHTRERCAWNPSEDCMMCSPVWKLDKS